MLCLVSFLIFQNNFLILIFITFLWTFLQWYLFVLLFIGFFNFLLQSYLFLLIFIRFCHLIYLLFFQFFIDGFLFILFLGGFIESFTVLSRRCDCRGFNWFRSLILLSTFFLLFWNLFWFYVTFLYILFFIFFNCFLSLRYFGNIVILMIFCLFLISRPKACNKKLKSIQKSFLLMMFFSE